MTLFLFGIFVGSGLGFLAASLLSIGHDADLIDRIQIQERHIRELARQLQDAQAAKIKYDELETNLTGLVDDLLSALESAEYHGGAWLISDAAYSAAIHNQLDKTTV